ncbi:MAG: PAS domain S-box protein [Henriciella sp.]
MTILDDDELGLERLAAIVESSDDAIISKSLDGIVRTWNKGAEKIFGYTADEMIGQPILKLIPPELQDEETEILSKLRAGKKIDHFDTVRLTKDGRRMDISLTVSPLRDPGGKIIGASKVARDITERKRAERLQKLLVDELNHRVKNTLATVQALANQSLANCPDPASFAASFKGRLQALANAHDLLVKERMQGLLLQDLIEVELRPDRGGPRRVDIHGPRIILDGTLAVQMALIFHELTTNARKYGALNTPQGRVEVSWKRNASVPDEVLISWHERTPAAVTPPKASGFGTRLIEKSLQAIGGRATFDYGPHGLDVEMAAPIPESAPPSILVEAPDMPSLKPGAVASPPKIEGLKVLLVEDEVVVAMDMEFKLEELGCAVIGPAASVQEALSVLSTEQPDIALVDANLAGERVDEVVKALSERNIPFVFSTGYGRETLPADFRDAGILAKPFNDDQLNAALQSLASEASRRATSLSGAN